VTEEVTVGFSDLMGYEIYDFVMIAQNQMGVVVAVGPERLSVIDNHGKVSTVSTFRLGTAVLGSKMDLYLCLKLLVRCVSNNFMSAFVSVGTAR